MRAPIILVRADPVQPIQQTLHYINSDQIYPSVLISNVTFEITSEVVSDIVLVAKQELSISEMDFWFQLNLWLLLQPVL